MKKIKDNITEEQFKLLISSLKGNDTIRVNRRDRLIKQFNLLYYLGIRVNETTQFTNNMINELLNNKKLIIKSHKQHSEKNVYLSDNGVKQLKKIFTDIPSNDNYVFTSERGTNNQMNPLSIVRDVNTYLKTVFGKNTRITSHSFRQTLISNMSSKGINVKIIQNLIGHKSINTTYRYIKTSETDLLSSLELVR